MSDVITFVADGIATGSTVYCISFCLLYYVLFYLFVSFILFYFHLNMFCFILFSELLNRTLSHICGRWDLPTFLFRKWIVDPYVYRYFYEPHEVLVLPLQYTEVLQCSIMTCDVKMVKYWGKHIQMKIK